MTRRQRIDDLTTFVVPEQPALSPDGSQVVYVLRTSDADADAEVRTLWRVGVRDGEPQQLTRGQADAAPAWSPDGSNIAFLRAQDGPPQIWLLPAAGGEPEKLTALPLGAGAPLWSPDGSKLAFAAPVDQHAAAGDDDQARARRAGAPIETDRLDYQADGAGLLRTIRKHLHVLELDTRQCRPVTSGDWHAGDPAWSPGSDKLAFAAATAPDADLTARAPVYVLDVTGAPVEPELAGLADGIGGPVGWTPDATALLVVGTTGSPSGHNRLLRVPLDRSAVTDLAACLDRNVMPGGPGYPGALPQFSGDKQTVLFCVRDHGCTHVYSVPAAGGTPSPVVTGAGRNVLGVSVSGTMAAIVLATPTSFGEVVVVDLAAGSESVRTSHGASLAAVELFARQEREFTISDGTVVQGWLIRDPARGGQPRPLLLDIHGGPHNAWNGAADPVHLYHQELAARGWTVLLLNPRASDGYGEQFFTAALGRWGEADARDFLEPVDQLVAEGVADPARLAVAGYSYGGFMTCYLTSRDSRFAAAVAGGLVADLVSMAGTSDAGHFLSEYELAGQPRADPQRYTALSPLAQVGNVRTPTLLMHGTGDMRCPVGQAEQCTPRCASGACRPGWCSTRTPRICSSSTAGLHTGSTSTGAWSSGLSSTRVIRPDQAGHESTPPDGSAGSARWRNGTGYPALRWASCACGPAPGTNWSRQPTECSTPAPGSRRQRTRYSRSDPSPRSGQRRSSCNCSTRACSTSTRRSRTRYPSCG